MERLRECPGSYELSRGIQSEGSDYSDYGDEVHLYLATREQKHWDALSEDMKATAEKAISVDDTIIRMLNIRGEVKTTTERRLWSKDNKYSGKFDRLYVVGRTALLIDYKTLYGDHPKAEENLQLMTAAVLLSQHMDLDIIHTALNQPNVSPRFTLAYYDRELIDFATGFIEYVVDRAINDNGKTLKAGKHCRFCPAKPTCLVYGQHIKPVLSAGGFNGQVSRPWSPEEWALFLDKLPMVKDTIKEKEEEARRILESDPGAIPGYELAKGKTYRSISGHKQKEAFEILLAEFGIEELFEHLSTITPKKVEDMLVRRGLKPKDAKKKAQEMIGELVHETLGEPTLRKSKA